MKKENIIEILESLKQEYESEYPSKDACNYEGKKSHLEGKIHAVDDIIDIFKNI